MTPVTGEVAVGLVIVGLVVWVLAILLHGKEWDARVEAGRASFTCPRCGATSHHPEDVKAGYCGACHDWTGSDQNRPTF